MGQSSLHISIDLFNGFFVLLVLLLADSLRSVSLWLHGEQQADLGSCCAGRRRRLVPPPPPPLVPLPLLPLPLECSSRGLRLKAMLPRLQARRLGRFWRVTRRRSGTPVMPRPPPPFTTAAAAAAAAAAASALRRRLRCAPRRLRVRQRRRRAFRLIFRRRRRRRRPLQREPRRRGALVGGGGRAPRPPRRHGRRAPFSRAPPPPPSSAAAWAPRTSGRARLRLCRVRTLRRGDCASASAAAARARPPQLRATAAVADTSFLRDSTFSFSRLARPPPTPRPPPRLPRAPPRPPLLRRGLALRTSSRGVPPSLPGCAPPRGLCLRLRHRRRASRRELRATLRGLAGASFLRT